MVAAVVVVVQVVDDVDHVFDGGSVGEFLTGCHCRCCCGSGAEENEVARALTQSNGPPRERTGKVKCHVRVGLRL